MVDEITVSSRYTDLPGDVNFVYRSLCEVLAGNKSDVDWGQFGTDEWKLLARMGQADAEGVGPLLYWHFRDGSWPDVMPQVVRDHLMKTYYNTFAQNTLMYRELARILESFSEAGIPVILLKGAALALTVYEDIGLRPMGDLDLLVRPEDLRKAWQIMGKLNYEVLSANTEVVLRNFEGPEIGVDLHWCIISGHDSNSYQIKWFEKETKTFPIPFTEVSATTPAPSIHLPYIISHSFGVDYLRALMDIYYVAQIDDIQIEEVVAIAKEAGWTNQLSSMLRRVEKVFPTFDRAEKFLSNVPESEDISLISRTTVLFQAWSMLEPLLVFKLILRIIFPTKRYLEWRYRRKISLDMPIWFIVRWFDLLLDFISTFLGKIPGLRKPRTSRSAVHN